MGNIVLWKDAQIVAVVMVNARPTTRASGNANVTQDGPVLNAPL